MYHISYVGSGYQVGPSTGVDYKRVTMSSLWLYIATGHVSGRWVELII